MRIPKSINVLGDVIRVEKIKSWDKHKDVPVGLVGRFYSDSMTIYLDVTHPKSVVDRFFLHELGHAIMCINGLSQTANPDIEEVIVHSFASFYFNQGRNLFRNKQ